MVNADEIIFDLIKKEKDQSGGFVYDKRIVKMATLLNIHPDKYQKIKTRLIESGKVSKDGQALFLL